MTNPPRRKGSLGCLGVFSIFVMLVFSSCNAGALNWLNPDWFDRVAFWRGARFEKEALLLNDAETKRELAAINEKIMSQPVAPPPQPTKAVAFDFALTEVPYTVAGGAVLKAPEGTKIEIPAGAIGEDCKVGLAPMFELPESYQADYAGVVYDLRIGEHEHYRFRRPLRVTMPYLPPREATTQLPKVVVSENGRWVELPTTVDTVAHTVTVDLPHASFIGTVWSTVTGPIRAGWGALSPGAQRLLGYPAAIEIGSRVLFSGTVRGKGRAIAWAFAESYKTKNFNLHYTRTGANAVSLNPDFNGRPDEPGKVPDYVVWIGDILEEARENLAKEGWDLPEARVRYDGFLIGTTSYGESALSGPLLINAKLPEVGKKDNVEDIPALIRATVVHELMHVAQGSYYGIRKSMMEETGSAVFGQTLTQAMIDKQTWWVEMTGAYMGDTYWSRRGVPTDMVSEFYARNPQLPSLQMTETTDPDHYGYASFLLWMDGRSKDAGYELMKKVYSEGSSISGVSTLQGIDEVLRKHYRQSLGTLFTEYAQDFYVDDMWEGKLFPAGHRKQRSLRAIHDHFGLKEAIGTRGEFIRVSQPVTTKKPWGYSTNDYAMSSLSIMPAMTAHPAYLLVDNLPEERRAKLVIHAAPLPGKGMRHLADAKDVEFHLATGILEPEAGKTELELPAYTLAPSWSKLDIDAVAKKGLVLNLREGKAETKPNFFAILGVNRSVREPAPGFLLERWLLMPPEEVQYDSESAFVGKKWTVRWKRSGLKDAPQAFANYVVYRKAQDKPDTDYEIVTRTEEEVVTITEKSEDGFIYTVAVEDKLGNVSEKAQPLNKDPFEGEWEGKFTLVKGSPMEFVSQVASLYAQALQEKHDKEMALEKNRAERTKMDEEWKRTQAAVGKLWSEIEAVLKTLEDAARLGVPMTFEIKRGKENDTYVLIMKEVLYQELDAKDMEPIELRRRGNRTLGIVAKDSPFPEVLFTLTRMQPASSSNVLAEDNYVVPPIGAFKGCTFKWSFERKRK